MNFKKVITISAIAVICTTVAIIGFSNSEIEPTSVTTFFSQLGNKPAQPTTEPITEPTAEPTEEPIPTLEPTEIPPAPTAEPVAEKEIVSDNTSSGSSGGPSDSEKAQARSIMGKVDIGYAQSLLATNKSELKKYIYSCLSASDISTAMSLYSKYGDEILK